MKEGKKVDKYFARALTIANKMKAHEERMEQNVIVEKILRSMTPMFDYMVCSIEESNNVDTMTIDELQSILLVHEQRMNCHSRNARDEQDLKVLYGERYEGRDRGRSFVRGCGRGRGRYFANKATVECFKCQNLGHFQYECPSWEKSENYAEFDEEEEMLLMSYIEVNNSKREDVWFLDLGCSNHMCGNRQRFSNIDEVFRHLVKLDHNIRMGVMGKGNIRLEINGSTQVVTDVYFDLIPCIK